MNYYSYKCTLEQKGTVKESPPQTSQHATVRHEFNLFSQFLDTMREALFKKISQNIKHHLQRILEGFIKDYFVQNLDCVSTE